MRSNGVCRDCGNEVLWARVPSTGKAMALDPDPHPLGTRALDPEGNVGPPEGAGGGYADRSVRHMPHRLTCAERQGRGS
jgi:hypothetical protein